MVGLLGTPLHLLGPIFFQFHAVLGSPPVWEILDPPLSFSGKSSFCLIVVSILNPLDEVAYVNRSDVAVIFAESQ